MVKKTHSYRISRGTATDVPALLGMVRELAAFEREPNAVIVSEADLIRDGFGPAPQFEFFMAFHDATPVGMAFFYPRYSTWKGPTLHLEDFYIVPEHRGTGVAAQLFEAVVDIAAEREVGRMEWTVLEWNERAIAFYKKYGARLDPEWMLGTFDREALGRWKRREI